MPASIQLRQERVAPAGAPWHRVRIWLRCLAGLAVWTAAQAETVWRLDNLEKVGGEVVRVVGHPRLETKGSPPGVIFDGAHDGLFVDALPLEGAAAFTIELLFCPSADGPREQRFLHLQDAEGRRGLLELRTDDQGRWWLDAFLRATNSPQDPGVVLIDPKLSHPMGQWYWVAMRYDGKRMTSFVNGVQQLEGELSGMRFGKGKTSIGVRQNLVSWFKGAIREIRFHAEALPAEKLQRVTK